jgi:hypothetical protein
MSNLVHSRTVVRIGFRLDAPGKKSIAQNGADPVVWAGNDWALQFAALWGESAIRSLEEFEYVRVDILPSAVANPDNPLITAQLDAGDLANDLALADWTAGTAAQGEVVITRAQMAALTIPEGAPSATYWLVAWGLTTHSPAREITLGVASLTVARDRNNGTPPEPGESQVWLDVDAADARYVRRLSGSVAIGIGESAVAVVLANMPAAPARVLIGIRLPDDESPLIIGAVAGEPAIDGFDVVLSAAPAVEGYILDYLCILGDPS